MVSDSYHIERLKKFAGSVRAQTGADRAVDTVVGLTVAALVSAFLVPIGIDELVGVDTSSWSSQAANLWDILGLAIVLGVFLIMINMAVRRRD